MAATTALALALVYGLAAPTVGLDWHPTWPMALKASAKSGHVAYIFVYLPYRAACGQMDERTFSNTQVIKGLAKFECGQLNAALPENADFIRKYKLAYMEDPHTKAKLAVVPAHVFLAPDGKVLLREYGYIPAPGFVGLLDQVEVLRHCEAALKKNPHDASACAQMGHTLLLVGKKKEGRRYSELAIAYDPGGTTSGPCRARLDLAVVEIKGNPKLGLHKMKRWWSAYKDSSLRLEGRFYLATAYYAAGDTKSAQETLLPFVDAHKGTPEADSEWGALGRKLYQEIHG